MRTVCLSLLTILLLTASLRAEVVDRVVAVVNDEVITLSEVNEAARPLLLRVTAEIPPGHQDQAIEEVRARVLDDLVNRKIMEAEAARRNITVSEEEIDRALANILKKGTREQFEQELAAMGMTEEQYRDNLRVRILQAKLVNMEVRSRVVISEDDIIDYYDTHYTEQVRGGGYYLLQIGCEWDEDEPGSRDKALKRIREVLALARKGEDFKKLAYKYSDMPSAADGGDIGIFTLEDMAPGMRKAVEPLSPGQVSDVVEMGGSFQIFKLLSSKDGEIITKVPYEEAKDEIQEILHQQAVRKRYEEWIKEIREQAYVKIL